MPDDKMMKSLGLGLLGAAAGGVAGHFLAGLLQDIGLHGGMLPGAGVGLGFAFGAKRAATGFGILCLVLGLAAGLITNSIQFPFLADPSQAYYFSNLQELDGSSKLMILLGALAAGWFGKGRGEAPPDRE